MVRALERRAFSAAATLSGIAGFVDGVGFIALGGFFVSFMSGNTTAASVGVAQADWSAVALGGILIVSFVAGVMAGTAMPAGGDRAPTRILALVVVALLLAAVALTVGWTWLAGAVLAIGMGAMNTVFSRDGEAPFGVTYMTGALVKVGQGLVESLRGGRRGQWVRHLVLWAAIALGAALGAVVYALLGVGALWALAVVLLVLLLIRPTRVWLRG